MADEQSEIRTVAGNVGQKPTKRTTGKGTVVNFTLAENISKDEVKWYRIGVWSEGLHDEIMKTVKKGTRLVVTGKFWESEYNKETQYNLNAFRVGVVDWMFPAQSKGEAPATDEEAVGW